ncbi:MAG TPA: cohesin domain-containing protein [Candidatus Eisenbacteria bacterium]|nr:cohesin domain-containing protein [Candidatus Eisenbacteria bacterium]
MKRLTRVLALLLIFGTLPAVATDKAKTLYKQGLDAEVRQDYEAAYNYYHQAYQLKPTDITYRASFERVRFLASASHVHRGQLLEKSGKLQEALTEFEQALAIDPSSFIAQQEINKVSRQLKQAAEPGPPNPSEAAQSALHKRMEEASGPVELAPIANTPITLKLSADSKTIYETIGKLAGINVLFDPDYTARNVRVELNGVTLQEALEITALESKTFWRPVTPNTIFVAADTPAKRKEVEQSVIRTFYLTNLSQPNELQDLVNILRTLLDTQRLQQFPSQQAIVIRGTPDQIALAEKLIDDLDKSRPEVVVDVVIMQVQRNKLRDLGITPPTNVSVSLIDNTTTSTSTSGSNVGTGNGSVTTTTGGTAGTINLNTLAHLNATNFQVTIPPATATFLYNDSNTKILQQPQIRALDGQKASLKIGQRVPVATGSFQPGIGGVGINPLVNTQFNYIDVGVNIDVTPHVHGTDQVTLKVAMDISAVDSYVNIGGIQQPVIGQRKIEHEIRMREGEANIMGGILEETESRSINGIPGLASIPFFRYFFSSENKQRQDNELVFMLIPHIVRAQDVFDSNTRAIDVGTANAISLHRSIAPAQEQPATTPPTSPTAAGAGNPPAEQSAATAPAGSALFSFDPPSLSQAVGTTFTVNVNLAGGQNVYSVPLQILYNPNVLQLVNVSNGPLLSQDGQAVALVHRDDSMMGILQLTASRPPGSAGITGDGQVFTLTFQAKAPGQATLTINRAMLKNASMQTIPAGGSQAIITVH